MWWGNEVVWGEGRVGGGNGHNVAVWDEVWDEVRVCTSSKCVWVELMGTRWQYGMKGEWVEVVGQ